MSNSSFTAYDYMDQSSQMSRSSCRSDWLTEKDLVVGGLLLLNLTENICYVKSYGLNTTKFQNIFYGTQLSEVLLLYVLKASDVKVVRHA